MRRWSAWWLAGLALVSLLALGVHCPLPGLTAVVVVPARNLVSAPGDVAVDVMLPMGGPDVTVKLDLVVQDPALFSIAADRLTGTIPGVSAGRHVLTVETRFGGQVHVGGTSFSLLSPTPGCDPLNQVECLLPFPSSHWTVVDPTTPNLLRVDIPSSSTPSFRHLIALPSLSTFEERGFDTTRLAQNDGFSPTAQVMMHFPVGPDPVASNAPRLDPATRHWSTRALDADSPTLLIDFETGQQINHWIENDARATGERVITFLRPTVSLTPGRRYIVAVRNLVDTHGVDLEPEIVFHNIREGAPSDLPIVNQRRAEIEPVLQRLTDLGVDRSSLLLAFDFTVMSDAALTDEMLFMRDQAFAWLDPQIAQQTQTFNAQLARPENDCSVPGTSNWRLIEGTFQAPLFLERDPFVDNQVLGEMNRAADGIPLQNGFTDVPYAVSIPCSVFAGAGFAPAATAVLGHGLFGDGPDFVRGVTDGAGDGTLDVALGGVSWIGLSNNEVGGCNFATFDLDCFITRVVGDLDQTPSLADRLRQGMLHALILARMMEAGAFNLDPLFQSDGGQAALVAGASPGYFGASLGGIMGTMFAALTPDVQRLNVDVPGVNFSLLLQRATPFEPFQLLLDLLINPDPMDQIIGVALSHEIWVRGEPAGYLTHVRGTPLRGVPGPKDILMTVALYDHQVTNLAAMISGATMGLPNFEGSALRGIPGMTDTTGPETSAFVMYDAGSFDLGNPIFDEFIPPITNQTVQTDRCDPHPVRATIPASLDQLSNFLDTGLIVNFCIDDGVCNGSEPDEIPGGAATACNPL